MKKIENQSEKIDDFVEDCAFYLDKALNQFVEDEINSIIKNYIEQIELNFQIQLNCVEGGQVVDIISVPITSKKSSGKITFESSNNYIQKGQFFLTGELRFG